MVLNRSVDPVPQSAQQLLASIRTSSRVAFGGPQDQGWLPVLRTATGFPSTHTTWSGWAQWLRAGRAQIHIPGMQMRRTWIRTEVLTLVEQVHVT